MDRRPQRAEPSPMPCDVLVLGQPDRNDVCEPSELVKAQVPANPDEAQSSGLETCVPAYELTN